ncbi:hypothetical protein MNBD_BACTEROID07-1964 [hydrothermal vent metagenome]|uniref:Phosphate-selective porin O and P n=1 Tax=hydrothermal vent metagenome TaxID=652676 RepID=A0A3B0UH41_9ZZZZ
MKKYRYYLIVLLLVTVTFPTLAQTATRPTDKVEWHSYVQLWSNTNFNRSYTMALRRLKFWMGSGPAFSEHWSFKVQALFTSLGHENFFLQDVFGQYRNKSGVSSIRFGQFIPKFSVQRFQPDYLIPSVERAAVINVGIPDGTLGARDMGFQYTLKAAQKHLEVNFGVFNGYGIKKYRLNYSGYLLIQNLSYAVTGKNTLWKFGYSVMYRKAEGLQFKHILPDSVLFNGNDFRCDVYALFNSKHLDIQAEYLSGWLNGERFYGYYALATVKINPKNEFYLSYDKFQDLISTTDDGPWYITGYNYLIKKHDLMLTLDTRFRKETGRLRNIMTLQFQMFFH